MIGGKMLEESSARVNTAEKGGKGLRVLGKGERIKFYLDGLDRRFEVKPIVIRGPKSCSKLWDRVFSSAGSVNILHRKGSEASHWK
jgi:hypothetical protein